MHITIQHHGEQFNVQIASRKGEEHFLSIKGCRLMESANGQFVSFPARKTDSGKWWSHVWANDKFQNAVIKAYNDQPPQEDEGGAKKARPASGKSGKPSNPPARRDNDDHDDEIPF